MNALVPVGSTPAMTVSDVERVALAIAKGGLFGSKDPNAVLTLCLLAQAEGQHPAVVFRDYHIISGKPAKKAEAIPVSRVQEILKRYNRLGPIGENAPARKAAE